MPVREVSKKCHVLFECPIKLFFLQKLKHIAEDLNDVVKREKKELLGKIETQGSELKRKIEMETNEIRCQFNQRSTSSFYAHRSRKRKKIQLSH